MESPSLILDVVVDFAVVGKGRVEDMDVHCVGLQCLSATTRHIGGQIWLTGTSGSSTSSGAFDFPKSDANMTIRQTVNTTAKQTVWWYEGKRERLGSL